MLRPDPFLLVRVVQLSELFLIILFMYKVLQLELCMDEDIGYNLKIMRNKWIDRFLHLTYGNFLKCDKSITKDCSLYYPNYLKIH